MLKSGQEWVSSAVDGEVDAKTLAELSADENSHKQWQNYHMIGDAMRGELPQTIDLDLTANIAAAIELEPAIIAPQTETTSTHDAKVATTETKKDNVVPFFKQFGQYAIAATVAMVAIVGVQNYGQDQNADSPLPVLNTRPLVGTASPVSLQTGAVQNQSSVSNDNVVEQRRRINSYIQDHMLQQRLNSGVVVQHNDAIEQNVNK
ncbi:anti sigma-E factor RseA C-terminal domain-containing protein [Shewanella sp. 1_MG-2023]|uniref:Anti-sigma-E factor RseA n=1 Tax=Shewanella electrodiphila TaxID=934143 RepID=A0ABT0KK82_9GAMM|nr:MULTISPECIES: anti sigma-E factor RseA C-terminal domain-containing protein [Shewanella]MCC4831215.1 anti-sigma factor [Shewanella sp. 10N.7]MCL1044024.1 anti-sigma factor [Shewanella electrodiphila]MDO6610009.1 anti sigma-E factor RseA C-terminal domain-containing protein [Shewanella sp. 7_MG-2023]MDO6769849.1 anti sigma-E factor RseA C-terminal domain-containing protein [Shewanella sp. 2_MG-2023]MDO6792913.1 anti sigma-E factor RseA C-terminal domain-containing protein [Shewanella sp. 1_M